MRKRRETRGLMSRLPEEEAYWEALTDRLVTDAAGRLSAYRGARTRWWHDLARYSTPLTVGAAAAVIAALLWLPEVAREPAGGTSPAALYGLAPADPLAAPLFLGEAPPPMQAMLGLATKRSDR